MNNKNNILKPKLSPILNPVFLSLFCEKRKYNLENFLSCLFKQKIKIDKIETEHSLQRSRPEEKISRIDVYATTEDEREIIIEIQLKDPHNMPERLQFSNCSKLAKQLESGDNYKNFVLLSLLVFSILEFQN